MVFQVSFLKILGSWLEIYNICMQDSIGHKGKLLKQLNFSILNVIPKSSCLIKLRDSRPIACRNALYKNISKVLCTGLNKVLPFSIDPAQAGFVNGKTILESLYS